MGHRHPFGYSGSTPGPLVGLIDGLVPARTNAFVIDMGRLIRGRAGWAYSNKPEEGRQVTLFEQETLEALRRDHGIALEPRETRRNVITRGIPLNHLVGRRFLVGDVLLEGMRLNTPCRYLEDLLGIEGLFKALIHRSGLNCRILTEGEIRVGDTVRPVED